MNDEEKKELVRSLNRQRKQSVVILLLTTVICSGITILLAVQKAPIYDITGAAGVAIFTLNLLVQNEFGETPVDLTMLIGVATVAFLAFLIRTLCAVDASGFGKTVQDIFAALAVLVEVLCDVVFLILAAFRLVVDHRI